MSIVTTSNEVVETSNTVAAPTGDVQETSVEHSEVQHNEGVESTQESNIDDTLNEDALHEDTDADDDSIEDQDAGDEGSKRKSNSFSKRISRMRQKQAWQEEELLRARNELAAIKAQLQPVQAPAAIQTEDREPTLEDFPDSFTDYVTALTEYKARQLISREFSQRENMTKEQAAQKTYQERMQEAAKRYPDIVETLSSMSDVPAPDAEVLNYLYTSELGPEIAYHLAKDKNELRRIVSLGAVAQAIEVAKVETVLRAKQESKAAPVKQDKKITSAPKPAASLDGSTAIAPVTSADLANDYMAWKAKRAEEEKTRGRRR